MVAEVVGGAVMMTGGGLLTASSVVLAQVQRRATEFGRGLREALRDIADAPPPADMADMLGMLP